MSAAVPQDPNRGRARSDAGAATAPASFHERPLSPEQLAGLRAAFDIVGTHLGEATHELVGASVNVAPTALDVVAATKALENAGSGVVAVLRAAEWNARAIVTLERALIDTLVEAGLGGDGTETVPADRTLTEFDVVMAGEVVNVLMRELGSALAELAPVTLAVESMETAFEGPPFGGGEVPVVWGRWKIQILERESELRIVIPEAALRPYRTRLERELEAESTGEDRTWTRQLRNGVASADVTVEVCLPIETRSLGELAELRPGVMLPLTTTIGSPVTLECEGEQLFLGQLAQARGMLVMTLTDAAPRKDEAHGEVLAEATA